MCGRYCFSPNENDEIKRIYDLVSENSDNIKTGEVFPSDTTALILADEQKDVLVTGMQWGFQGFKPSQLIINARSETVKEKKMFSSAFKSTRCVFPTTGFFEWDKEKSKYLFTLSAQPIYICGFYKKFKEGPRSIIITIEPNQSVSPIHNRMPLLIAKADINDYLTNDDFADNYLKRTMPELTVEKV
ncbi:SOS response-associated peptidase family protein [Carnobacterium sp.]|uniref:SOS response-associated peptidase n=1 Tax=Carnobacterium sp. TaxID=48221 RepID=UPI0028A96FBD|nr:SOS response-associated peptidase family protein [Carnobacterium sp.]